MMNNMQPMYGQMNQQPFQQQGGTGFNNGGMRRQSGGMNGSGTASKYNEDRCKNKIFIGGLDHNTTKEDLEQYFAKFGSVVDAVVMSDQVSGRSRGFGFVTFDSAAPLDEVQNTRPHTISNKQVDTKRALPKDQVNAREEGQAQINRKVFIGGIPQSASDDDVKNYCSTFGEVETIFVQRNKGPKLYAFVTFADHDNADKMTLKQDHQFEGATLTVKKAANKKAQNNSMNGSMNGSFGTPYGQMNPAPQQGFYQGNYMTADPRSGFGAMQMQQRPQGSYQNAMQPNGYGVQPQRMGGAPAYGGYNPYMQQQQNSNSVGQGQYGRPGATNGASTAGSYQYSSNQAYNPNK